MDLSRPGIDEDDGAALGIFFQDFFAEALEILVKRGDDVVARNGGLGDAFGGFPSLCIVGDMEASRLSLELEVEGLLDPLAALAFGEDQVLVLDGARGERGLLTRVADDVGCQFSVRVKTRVNLLELQGGGEPAPCRGEFLGPELLKGESFLRPPPMKFDVQLQPRAGTPMAGLSACQGVQVALFA